MDSDSVIFTSVDIIIEKDNKLLLVRRGKPPFLDMLCLPGGHVDFEESVEDAARREAKEETNLDVELIDILGVYSRIKRDPRGHYITVVFIAKIKDDISEAKKIDAPALRSGGAPDISAEHKLTEQIAKAGDDAKEIVWTELDSKTLENLAFDHTQVIKDYKKWKKQKGTYWSTMYWTPK